MGCCKSSQTKPESNEYQKQTTVTTPVDEDQIAIQIEVKRKSSKFYHSMIELKRESLTYSRTESNTHHLHMDSVYLQVPEPENNHYSPSITTTTKSNTEVKINNQLYQNPNKLCYCMDSLRLYQPTRDSELCLLCCKWYDANKTEFYQCYPNKRCIYCKTAFSPYIVCHHCYNTESKGMNYTENTFILAKIESQLHIIDTIINNLQGVHKEIIRYIQDVMHYFHRDFMLQLNDDTVNARFSVWYRSHLTEIEKEMEKDIDWKTAHIKTVYFVLSAKKEMQKVIDEKEEKKSDENNIVHVTKYLLTNTTNTQTPYIPHMSMKEAAALQIGDEVQYRMSKRRCGHWCPTLVVKKNGTVLTLRESWDTVTCDYTKDIHLLAKPYSISRRRPNRLRNLQVGDYVDVKPTLYSSEWTWGKALQLAPNSRQLEVKC
eukprot:469263_1